MFIRRRWITAFNILCLQQKDTWKNKLICKLWPSHLVLKILVLFPLYGQICVWFPALIKATKFTAVTGKMLWLLRLVWLFQDFSEKEKEKGFKIIFRKKNSVHIPCNEMVNYQWIYDILTPETIFKSNTRWFFFLNMHALRRNNSHRKRKGR